MRFKRILCMVGIFVILAVLSSILPGGDAWGQTPLTINYSGPNPMSCGGSQILSASGGCPPYNWSLSGGGTLTPSGGDNTSATYVPPASNPNCTNNAMITLTDFCKNTACIQLAVNCYTSGGMALLRQEYTQCGECVYDSWNDFWYVHANWEVWKWSCNGNLISYCQTNPTCTGHTGVRATYS